MRLGSSRRGAGNDHLERPRTEAMFSKHESARVRDGRTVTAERFFDQGSEINMVLRALVTGRIKSHHLAPPAGPGRRQGERRPFPEHPVAQGNGRDFTIEHEVAHHCAGWPCGRC